MVHRSVAGPPGQVLRCDMPVSVKLDTGCVQNVACSHHDFLSFTMQGILLRKQSVSDACASTGAMVAPFFGQYVELYLHTVRLTLLRQSRIFQMLNSQVQSDVFNQEARSDFLCVKACFGNTLLSQHSPKDFLTWTVGLNNDQVRKFEGI